MVARWRDCVTLTSAQPLAPRRVQPRLCNPPSGLARGAPGAVREVRSLHYYIVSTGGKLECKVNAIYVCIFIIDRYRKVKIIDDSGLLYLEINT